MTATQDASDRVADKHPAASVTVTCFGAFSVVVRGKPVERWRSGKARALLQYLIAHCSRPIARQVLIDALWPDPDAVAAGTSLKVAVHALRQTLKDFAPDLNILTYAASYELQAADVWVDAAEFERCCRVASQLERTGAVSQALQLYEQATDLYRGDFLADSTDEWVLIRREGFRDEYLHAAARLADVALAAADYHACIQRCRQILEQDRCREDAFRLLMVCHARLGQPSRVQRWYELCVRTLHQELDVQPARETICLYQALLGRVAEASDSATTPI